MYDLTESYRDDILDMIPDDRDEIAEMYLKLFETKSEYMNVVNYPSPDTTNLYCYIRPHGTLSWRRYLIELDALVESFAHYHVEDKDTKYDIILDLLDNRDAS